MAIYSCRADSGNFHAPDSEACRCMAGTRYTEEAALASHGVAAEYGLDYVRNVALVLSVCLGCGSIVVAPDAASWQAYKSLIDWDAVDCCPDAIRVIY